MSKVYYDKDADLKALKGKAIAIIGYGTQGRAQALCLRDSGLNVAYIGQRKGSKNYELAVADGFKPVSAQEAAKGGDFIQMLVPDEVMADIYKQDVAPHMKKGKILSFSHGFNIHFGQILPPPDVDVIMIAPKGPGNLVRRQYEEGKADGASLCQGHRRH
jgi:ketol-acid reductoisomerase